MDINRFTGGVSAYDEWVERQRRAAEVKKTNKKDFDSFSKELNAIWDNKCDSCYHRYSCKFIGKGTCPRPESYFTSIEHDAALTEEVLGKVLKRLENIDSCGFAMFSLCLIREIIDDVKKGR